MYNELSEDYDRFVNWQNRLAIELPFIIKNLQSAKARKVLDAATGTGMHATALAQLGYQASGADNSPGMIEKARRNSASSNVQVRFEMAGFGTLKQVYGEHNFDALLCLGNSLPHLLSAGELLEALVDFAACLKPGGLLLLQNRNFDLIMQQHARWMEPQSHSEGNTEWIFQRFYDFDPDGLITFNMVTLKREESAPWSQHVVSSRLRPLLQEELISSLKQADFIEISSFGNMTGDSFNPETSPNLVVISHRPST
jgi:ubiquinone/menaquinone biosynthesis C-methylase UbiE